MEKTSYPLWKSLGWMVLSWLGAGLAAGLIGMVFPSMVLMTVAGFSVLLLGWAEARKRGSIFIVWALGLFAALLLGRTVISSVLLQVIGSSR